MFSGYWRRPKSHPTRLVREKPDCSFPSEPNTISVPPNCSFEIDDIEQAWTWTYPFDYIFSRMMVGSFADWDGFVAKAYE